MNWLIPLPRFGDTRVAAHWTVLAACLASLLLHISAAGSDGSLLGPVLTVIVLLASLAVHDAVHLLIGRWYQQFPYRIIIFPTGSRFWFRGQPLSLRQDLLLHLAAPLANLALAFSAYLIRRWLHDDQLLFSWLGHWPPGSLLEILQNCNSFLFFSKSYSRLPP